MKLTRWQILPLLLFMTIALAAAACGDGDDDDDEAGSTDTPAGEESPGAATVPATEEPDEPAELSLSSVNVRADWVFNGQHAPFFVALDQGFFEEEGLEVEFNEGAGAAPTLQSLAGGNEDFVYSDQTVMFQLVDQGAELVSVMNITATNPNSYYALPGTELDDPKDLEGKRLGEQAGLDSIIGAVFFEVNDVDSSTIEFVSAAAQGLDASLLAGRIDVSTGFGNDSWVALKAQTGDPPPRMYVADWGVNPVSRGLITTRSMVEEHPDTIAALVRGLLRGYAYAQEHPEEASAAITSRHPEQDSEIVMEQVVETLALVDFDNPGMGEQARWEETRDLLTRAEILEGEWDDVTSLFTNEFIP